MKSWLLFIMGIAMSVSLACAQTSSNKISNHPLLIGDDASDLSLLNILHYPLKETTIARLKGKLIILDFWATWCGPCVAAFPKFEAIQKKWPDKVLILPVTSEKAMTVEQFFTRRPRLSLPTIVEDSSLLLRFPHKLIPHEVVIDENGKVIAITGSDNITEASVEQFLSANTADVPYKKDVMNFMADIPLLTDSNNDMEHTILFRSMVLPSLMGIASGNAMQTRIDGRIVGFNHVNTLIPHLYLFAVNRPAEWIDSRLLMENVKDHTRYVSENKMDNSSVATEWSRKNCFCYDIVAPDVPDSTRRKIMLETLNAYFGSSRNLQGSLTTRKMPCYLLKKIAGKEIPVSTSVNKINYSEENGTESFLQMSMADMAIWTENIIKLPVINDTHFKGHIDIKETSAVLARIKKGDEVSLNGILFRYGLQLVKTIRPVEVLLFKEK